MEYYGSRVHRGSERAVPPPETLALTGERGKAWYDLARASIDRYADARGFDPGRVADVLAITSPRLHVSRNVRVAHRYLTEGSTEGLMIQIRTSLARYEDTGVVGGPRALKIRSFAAALRGDLNSVVVDVWMVRAFGLPDLRLTPKRYADAVARIRRVAKRLGWKPARTQAAIWVGIREVYGYVNSGDLTMPI